LKLIRLTVLVPYTPPSLPAVGLPSVTVTPVSFTDGGLTFPAFRFDNPDASDDVPYGVNIEYAFSDGAGTPGPTGERFSHVMPPGQAQSTVYGLIPSRNYVIRAQSFYGTIQSAWTNWLQVSTSAIYTSGPATSIVGQGDLALLDFVNLGSNVRLADAITLATNSLLLTSLGTAAGIAGQGAFATISAINDTLADTNNLLRRSAGGLFTGQLAADVTALNTAAAIAAQGALATLGFTTLGSNVRLADGTTPATNALLLTSIGTAAAISGQGAFATLSSINAALADSNSLLRRTAGGLFTGALAADVTASNTAAGIAGQGALATQNFTQLGATVRLADGVTVATNALLLTSAGTAAAIAGQGFGATANQFTVDNQYPFLRMGEGPYRNANFAEPFAGLAIPPGWQSWVDGAGNFSPLPGSSGSGFVITGAAGANSGVVQGGTAIAGGLYLLEAELERSVGTLDGAGIYVSWRNASNVEISNTFIVFATAADSSGVTSTSGGGNRRWERIIQAPAGTVNAHIFAMNHFTGLGSVAVANQIYWRLANLRPLTLVSQLGANVTGLNTAAAIAGQGALATISVVATGNVAGGAISTVAAAYTIGTGGASAVGDGWTNYQSITITTTGGRLCNACVRYSGLSVCPYTEGHKSDLRRRRV
jgi:hypothetical protein